ncbi:hypothetical protein C0Q70_17550 [Pomacea canaliculata]|uniref:Uncharacterized protein n=1 Tax=Pomacea canaliculata TaxID=400727 RepID=A0A2T7NKR2_POMCA|nr:hypothetical protein C0Q70_17550 [Pomacea canaliculata]
MGEAGSFFRINSKMTKSTNGMKTSNKSTNCNSHAFACTLLHSVMERGMARLVEDEASLALRGKGLWLARFAAFNLTLKRPFHTSARSLTDSRLLRAQNTQLIRQLHTTQCIITKKLKQIRLTRDAI